MWKVKLELLTYVATLDMVELLLGAEYVMWYAGIQKPITNT